VKGESGRIRIFIDPDEHYFISIEQEMGFCLEQRLIMVREWTSDFLISSAGDRGYRPLKLALFHFACRNLDGESAP
jgi:hypothetical protein